MPLKEIKIFETGKIGIWDMTESHEAMLNSYTLSNKEKKEFSTLKIEKRKKEYLAVRLLLWKMLDEKTEIIYNESRKPFLENNNLNLSISHSDDLAVAIISKKITGIDVENTERSIKNLTTRIFTDEEFKDTLEEKYSNKKQIIYWCAKEAAFKCIAVKNFNYKLSVKICPFDYSESGGEFHGEYYEKGKAGSLVFKYFFYKNNVIVYCVK